MLIVGCGAVGGRLGMRARSRGGSVCCLVRQTANADRLERDGLQTRVVDLDNDAPALPPTVDLQQIYYLVPPPPAGTTDPRLARFLDEVRTIVGGRTVHPETDRNPGRFKLQRPARAGGQIHVR